MRLALLSPTPVPHAFGGMDRLLEGLTHALNRRHPTDLVTIPYDERSAEGVLRGYYDFHKLDLSAYDRVISYKGPAYMANHPNHVVYLSHRLRVFYDLYEERGPEHARMRDLIHYMDAHAFDPARLPHVFTVGETVTRRLMKFGGVASKAIHHPTSFVPFEYPGAIPEGSYLLSVGRLHPWKRIDLIVEAFRRSDCKCGLVIAGEGPEEAALRALAGDDPRIRFAGKVGDRELAELYAGAIATIFPPINEDMGLITFESFMSGRPILTTTDAGEPALIVREGETGMITEPTPEAMGRAMEWFDTHRAEARGMGEACLDWMRPVTWDRLVDALLAAGDEIEARTPAKTSVAATATSESEHVEPKQEEKRIRLLVTDNQIIDPPVGGGRVRILEIYKNLPADFTTTYVGEFDYPGPVFRDQQMTENFREILTPLTAPHFKLHNLLARLTKGKATIDVTMPVLGGWTPRYRKLIEQYLPESDFLICSHPWMMPFLPEQPGVPVIYDSHNCEAKVKAPLLTGSLTGRWLAGRVKAVEALAVRRADLILVCSPDDARAYAELYGAAPEKIHLAPNGVNCAALAPSAEKRAEARAWLGLAPDECYAIFTGSNYIPNLEAAERIIEKLAPEFPMTKFGILGGVGPMHREQKPEATVPANVNLAGFLSVEDLVRHYHAADLALNPMEQGSGTNIKMLDYMAAGLPILTTPTGARGLAGKKGEHWIEAAAGDFAAALRGLVANAETRGKLGEAGRKLALAEYDWKNISAKLAERLRELR